MTTHCLILFHSTHHALKGEKILKAAGFEPDAIPVPREFSANCGISICLAWGDRHKAEAVLQDKSVPVEGFHCWERG